MDSPRGGRSRTLATRGRAGDGRGESDELRELRDHVPGDAFKRIAWKASARRRRLIVKEMEREEREVVWIAVDASVELWAGEAGTAPLDHALDAAGALAVQHLTRGDQLGLAVVASRVRSWVPADEGAAQLGRVASAMASAANTSDADRSECDEHEVAARVMEHARPLDVGGLADLPRGDLDALAARADALRARAPFVPRIPQAPTGREQRLRHYCAAFGVELPPRSAGERERTDLALGAALEKILEERPRPSAVYVLAQVPVPGGAVERALARLRRRRVDVRFTLPEHLPAVERALDRAERALGLVLGDAIRARVRASKRRAEHRLRALGIRLRAVRLRARSEAPEPLARVERA